MRISRAIVDGSPRVLIESHHGRAIATVEGRSYEDLPELLAAARSDLKTIVPGDEVSIEESELLSAVGQPRKIVCVGLNYRGHAAEAGAAIPSHPMLFPKWATSITGPHDDIELPPESALVDWESELAFVFSRRCRRVPPDEVAHVVLGYTAANDVSMRDFQSHTTQFTAGKAWDRATPLGPCITTADELGGVAPDLMMTGTLNDVVVQNSRTNDLIFGIPELVAYLTTIMTMEPGDVVLTGTPAGVGVAANPQRGLTHNDVFEVFIEGIGRVRNRFVREQSLD